MLVANETIQLMLTEKERDRLVREMEEIMQEAFSGSPREMHKRAPVFGELRNNLLNTLDNGSV